MRCILFVFALHASLALGAFFPLSTAFAVAFASGAFAFASTALRALLAFIVLSAFALAFNCVVCVGCVIMETRHNGAIFFYL